MPNAWLKLEVNEPTLRSPTAKQMSETERSVDRSSAAARSQPPVGEVPVWRLAERAPELATEMRRRQSRRASERLHVERIPVTGIDEVLGAKQVPGGVLRRHARSIAAASRRPDPVPPGDVEVVSATGDARRRAKTSAISSADGRPRRPCCRAHRRHGRRPAPRVSHVRTPNATGTPVSRPASWRPLAASLQT